MVEPTNLLLPGVVTALTWFLATGLIAWLVNRDRSSFPLVLVGAGLIGLGGLAAIIASTWMPGREGVWLGFAGAMMVWAWHELGFLLGAVSGPRREPARLVASGWRRLVEASSTLIHHEAALALTAAMLGILSWASPNPIGAQVFALMFVLRLASKLNLFVGVPNSAAEMLPPHLDYLRSYFGPRRLTWVLPGTLVANIALAAWLASAATAAPPDGARAWGLGLLAMVAALGALEHLFLALPLRDGVIWGWALPRRRTA